MSGNGSSRKNTEKRAIPNWAFYGLLALLVVAALVIFFSTRSSPTKTAPTPTPTTPLTEEISVDRAYVLFNLQTVHFLDIRPSKDFSAYHIKNSLSIPADELSTRLKDVPTEGTIIVVDQFGGDQAKKARQTLLDAGFKSVTIISGGLESWIQKRFPLEGTAPY